MVGIVETRIELLRQWKKPIIIGEFATYKDNSRRYEFIEKYLEAAKELGLPALLWTHKNDAYGDIDATILKIWTLDKLEMPGIDTHIWARMSINRPYIYQNNFYKIQPDKLVQSPVKIFARTYLGDG